MTPTSGQNPPPRAALRKAPDAHVHPASSRLAADPAPAVAPPAPRPIATDGAGAEPGAKASGRKFGGSTSDVLRPSPKRDPKLLSGKSVAINVQLPKRLRKASAAKATTEGIALDEVIARLLADWLDRT